MFWAPNRVPGSASNTLVRTPVGLTDHRIGTRLSGGVHDDCGTRAAVAAAASRAEPLEPPAESAASDAAHPAPAPRASTTVARGATSSRLWRTTVADAEAAQGGGRAVPALHAIAHRRPQAAVTFAASSVSRSDRDYDSVSRPLVVHSVGGV